MEGMIVLSLSCCMQTFIDGFAMHRAVLNASNTKMAEMLLSICLCAIGAANPESVLPQ